MEALARHEEAQRLARWVQELDPDLKEALLLREQEGLDYAAIASTLEIPVGTVKTRIHRARLALRQRSEKPGNPGASGASKMREREHGM